MLLFHLLYQIYKKFKTFGQKMPKQLRKCLQVATFKSFKVKSGLRFALGPLLSSESFGSVFLDPIPNRNLGIFGSVRSSTDYLIYNLVLLAILFLCRFWKSSFCHFWFCPCLGWNPEISFGCKVRLIGYHVLHRFVHANNAWTGNYIIMN